MVKVDAAPDLLHPVTLAVSDQVKIGQLAVVIGNPFGLAGTMTVGIISALDRSLPASESSQVGPAFSIPDIIQTDAPINPGNSGGVLLNGQGQVIGVTAAIESPVRANAGVGFAIPSAIVQRVVPALVKGGTYEHPYLGISRTTLTLDLAKVMNLKDGIRGVLVVTVAPKGPAEKAGLQGSDKSVTIDGQNLASAMPAEREDFPIARLAALARLHLCPSEETLYQDQLSQIVAFVDRVAGAFDASASDGAADREPVLERPDAVGASLSAEAALANAPDATCTPRLVRVPKVIG